MSQVKWVGGASGVGASTVLGYVTGLWAVFALLWFSVLVAGLFVWVMSSDRRAERFNTVARGVQLPPSAEVPAQQTHPP